MRRRKDFPLFGFKFDKLFKKVAFCFVLLMVFVFNPPFCMYADDADKPECTAEEVISVMLPTVSEDNEESPLTF